MYACTVISPRPTLILSCLFVTALVTRVIFQLPFWASGVNWALRTVDEMSAALPRLRTGRLPRILRIHPEFPLTPLLGLLRST